MIQRTDYIGIGMTPVLEQEKNYNIVSFPLPDWLKPEADSGAIRFTAGMFRKRPISHGGKSV